MEKLDIYGFKCSSIITQAQCTRSSLYCIVYLAPSPSLSFIFYLSIQFLSFFLSFLSFFLSVCLSVFLSFFLSFFLSIYLPTYLSSIQPIYFTQGQFSAKIKKIKLNSYIGFQHLCCPKWVTKIRMYPLFKVP